MDYGYGYSPGMEEFFTALFGVFLIVLLLSAGVGLVLYILQSIGIMTIAARRGLSNPWLIWIPVAGVYTIGQVADDIHAREGGRTFFRWFLLGGRLVVFAVSVFSFVAAVSGFLDMLDSSAPFPRGDLPYSPMTPFFMFMSPFGGVASLISLGVYILSVVSLSYIYRCYKPENATVFTVLSVIFPFLQYVFPFVIRNRMPTWLNPPPYYGAPGGYPPEGGHPGGSPWQYAPPPPNYAEPPRGPYPGEGGTPQQQPPYGPSSQQPYTPYDGNPRQ